MSTQQELTNRPSARIARWSDDASKLIKPDATEAGVGGSEPGSGPTNLGATASPTGVTITSSTGDDVSLPLADGTNAGLMAPAQVTKLADLPTGSELSTELAAQDTAIAGKLTASADAIADVLEAAATGSPAALARIQSSVSGGGIIGASAPDISAAGRIYGGSAPAVTFSVSALATGQTLSAYVAGAINQIYGISGVNKAYLGLRAAAYPQNKCVVATNAVADSLGSPAFVASINYVGDGKISFQRYGDGSAMDLFVDGRYIGKYAPAVTTATAQAGTASTITLASSANATNGIFNQCYCRITAGTGAGQVRMISGYVGATKVATVTPDWTTAPDATSTYVVSYSDNDITLAGIDGGLRYLNLQFAVGDGGAHRIDMITSQLCELVIGNNDVVWPAEPLGGANCIAVGDSFWAGSAAPMHDPIMFQQVCQSMGWRAINLSSGSTGWWTRGQNNRLNFRNRIAPPAESWEYMSPSLNGATGGTYTISVTYNGVTSTTPALSYSATASAVEAALNALTFGGFSASSGVSWVGPAGQGCFCCARSDLGSKMIVVANGMPGATLSVDGSLVTGGTIGAVSQYIGDVAKNAPKDASGADLPFYLIVPGSGNDAAAAGYSTAALAANALYIATEIKARFPKAVPIFTGIISSSDGTGGAGVITQADIDRNAAIYAAAQTLPLLRWRVPYIETYGAGLGGDALFTGAGTVAAPTTGKRDVLKSVLAAGHPTGRGASYLAAWLSDKLTSLTRY